jgi:low temperature requirement protein LtrA
MILVSFCLGCAALALWVLVRFPALGPRRPTSVILAVLAVGVGLSLAGALFDAVTKLGGYGVALALVAVVLPVLTGAFWVTGCALRALAGMPGLRS